MKKIFWLCLLLIILGVGVLFGWTIKPAPPPGPPLPPEVIEVTKVEMIEVPVEVEGPAKVVEKVVWRTKEITVAEPVLKEVIRVVEKAATLGELRAQVGVEAFKFEGVEDGELRYGWKGRANCDVSAEGTGWVRLASAPLDMKGSYAVSTELPERKKGGAWLVELRGGWHSDGGYELGGTLYPWARRKGFRRLGVWINAQEAGSDEWVPQYETLISGEKRVSAGLAIKLGRLP